MQPLRKIAPALEYLCQVVHHLFRVAEYKGKLRLIVVEQTAEHLDLVLALHVEIILLDLWHRQLLLDHPDHLCIRFLVIFRDIQDRLRHGRREEDRLSVLVRDILQHRLNVLAESHVEHLVRLVQNDRVHMVAADRLAAQMIHHAPRRADDDLRALERADLLCDILPAVDREHFHAVHVFGKLADLLRRLHSKLPCRTQDQCLRVLDLFLDLLKYRNAESRRLSGSCLSLTDHIRACHGDRDRLALYGRCLLKAHLLYSPQYLRA